MARFWMAAAAAGLVATAGAGRAEFGGSTFSPPAPTSGGAMGPGGYGDPGPNPAEVYGLHPALRWMCFWKKDGAAGGCAGGKCGPNGGGGQRPLPPGYGTPGGPGGPMTGTLVFPQHPYVRSPRDYFMYEPGANR